VAGFLLECVAGFIGIRKLEAARHCAYIWRCFGDGIAFIYMDKHALKQTYFSTETLSVKQDAGFILGETGLVQEIALLEEALKHRVPALLTDLTNTIRHGDVCLMGGSDPFLIEVKTSKTLNNRGKQQKRNLGKLHAFFETDRAEGLRGLPEVRRRSHDLPERDYVEQLNACIHDARTNGYATCQPERGVCYVVLAGPKPSLRQILSFLNFTAAWIVSLNEAKATRSWAPYQSFVLTIEREADLWDFIRGELYIVAVVDTGVLCEIASNLGYQATFDQQNLDYPLRINPPNSEGTGVSAQMLGRIAMECVSPEWIVKAAIGVVRRNIQEISNGGLRGHDTHCIESDTDATQ
jgi:hypothetical protein